MTQKDTVLEILSTGRGITAAEALYDYGIGRLASRICELRKESYPILSIRTKGKNRNGDTVFYDTYRLDMEKYRGKHGNDTTEGMQG